MVSHGSLRAALGVLGESFSSVSVLALEEDAFGGAV